MSKSNYDERRYWTVPEVAEVAGVAHPTATFREDNTKYRVWCAGAVSQGDAT